jgi:transcriptional regulator with XRE-family HTH domain
MYRKPTAAEIGCLVRFARRSKSWKQLTLALDAKVSERTVQRIERGENVDGETLQRIAKALGLPNDSLTKPMYVPSEEDIQQGLEEASARFGFVAARELTQATDFDEILAADAYLIEDQLLRGEADDGIAAFSDQLLDWRDAHSDVSCAQRLEGCRSLFKALKTIQGHEFKTMFAVYTTDDQVRVAVLVFGPVENEKFGQHLMVRRRFREAGGRADRALERGGMTLAN